MACVIAWLDVLGRSQAPLPNLPCFAPFLFKRQSGKAAKQDAVILEQFVIKST